VNDASGTRNPMSAYTRVDLAQLPDYVPGRSIPGAIKLASNEVSAGPLPSVVAAIAAMTISGAVPTMVG